MNVHLNSFCSNRQTPESSFSHWECDNEHLLSMVQQKLEKNDFREGYRDGVILVSVNPNMFFTGIVELEDGDRLIGEYLRRRKGEEPRLSLRVDRKLECKDHARRVDVVLYHHDVLKEGNENETNKAWEIVAVNAFPTEEEAPIEPTTLMHNHFGSDGGTDTKMNPEAFEKALKESFNYWKNKGMLK